MDASVIMLYNAKEKLASVRGNVKEVPSQLYDLTDDMSKFTDDDLTPIRLINTLSTVMYYAKQGKSGPLHGNAKISRELINNHSQIAKVHIQYFPIIVDKIADEVFAASFRLEFAKYFGKFLTPNEANGTNHYTSVIIPGSRDIPSLFK